VRRPAELSSEELALLQAFDGAYATTTSLGRNSGFDCEQVGRLLERLIGLGLASEQGAEAFPGWVVAGYQLTTDGAALLGGGVAAIATPGPLSRPSSLAGRALELA
jgi:hypothetical protein